MIELLVTIAIAAVLGTLAAPSIRDFIVRSRINSAMGEFTSTIIRARNEATTKNTCISMCKSANAGASSPTCSANGTDWQEGWILFVNTACDSSLNAPPSAADLLLARVSNSSEITIATQSNIKKMMFDNRGGSGLNAASEFDLSYGGPNSAESLKYGVNLCLDALGRVRTIPGIKKCNNY